MSNVIGLTGKKGHGKDTAANLIKNKLESTTELLAFAEPLKQAVCILFCLPREYVDDPVLKETPLPQWGGWTTRQILQWLGTDILRDQFDKDIFLKNMMFRIEKSNSENILITDVRFDNEAELVNNSLNGKVIEINANERVKSLDDHKTEKGISDNLKYMTFYNNTTMEDLEKEINNQINQFKK